MQENISYINIIKYKKGIYNRLRNIMKKIYIVGAHSRARTLATYLKYLYSEILIEAYLVNNEEENSDFIEDVPVIHFNRALELHTEYPIYIGTRGVYHERLEEELRKYGFTMIYPVTVELDLQLRNAYLEKYFAAVGRRFLKIGKLDELVGVNKLYEMERKEMPYREPVKQFGGTIYVVRNICDKSLKQPYELKNYEKEIQAGAALTDKRLSEGILTDAHGENISLLNKQFCELTVLYWIWKNNCEDIVGMVHYRRHFILPYDWDDRMRAHGIDVILPVPLYVGPSLSDNYKSRHDPSDWEFLMEYLRNQDEESFDSVKLFFEGNLYSPCNMFIMKKSVLNDLCEWMFPILEAVVSHGGQKEDGYLNRYPGFISERLISYFFDIYKDKYTVVYADKNFLQ